MNDKVKKLEEALKFYYDENQNLKSKIRPLSWID